MFHHMVSFREASMRIYTQTTKVHSAGCTYLYYHVHIYVHLTIIIKEKETTNLRLERVCRRAGGKCCREEREGRKQCNSISAKLHS